MIVDGGVDCEEALGRSGRSKALHCPLSSTDTDVRSLDAVVFPFRLVMSSRKANVAEGRAVGSPFIGDDSSRCETMLLQQFTHQLQCRPFVALRLNQDVEHLTVLVDRSPQIQPATADQDVHFVQMPLWMCPWAPASQTSRDRRAELLYPSPDSFVGDLDPPFSHELLDIAKAQVETDIEPNGALDDRGREVEVPIADRVHSVSLARSTAPAYPSL